MTKKHFDKMYEIFDHHFNKEWYDKNQYSASRLTVLSIANAFCEMAEEDNPRFTRDRFMKFADLTIQRKGK